MIRLLLSIGLGAGLMYLFDSQRGRERRQMLMDRLGRGRADFTERADEALQAGSDSYNSARDRVQTTAGRAASRVGETAGEAKSQAQEWANETRDRMQTAGENSNPKK